MGESRVNPALVGGLLAILVVASIAGYGFWKSRAQVANSALPTDSPVIVAVVLPDLRGVRQPRALAVYTIAAATVTSESIDPGTTATIPGTSSDVLAGAYLYGGGDMLAQSYARLKNVPEPGWIVIDETALARLNGGRGLDVKIPAPIDVFDGTQLTSYVVGTSTVEPADLGKLMEGAAYLGASDQATIRDQISSAALTALERSPSALADGVRTSMQPLQLEHWLELLSQDTSSTARQ